MRRDHVEVALSVFSSRSQDFDHALEATYFANVKSNNAYGIFTPSGQIFVC